MRIAKNEGLSVSEDAVSAIIYIAQGDMRRAINALQGAAIINNNITENMIYEITSNARPDEILELIQVILQGDFEGSEQIFHELVDKRGIAPNELISQFYRTLVKHPVHRTLKVEMISHLGQADFRLSEGGNSDIQMEALLANCVLSAQKYQNII